MHNWHINDMCLFRCVRQIRVTSDSIDLPNKLLFSLLLSLSGNKLPTELI